MRNKHLISFCFGCYLIFSFLAIFFGVSNHEYVLAETGEINEGTRIEAVTKELFGKNIKSSESI